MHGVPPKNHHSSMTSKLLDTTIPQIKKCLRLMLSEASIDLPIRACYQQKLKKKKFFERIRFKPKLLEVFHSSTFSFTVSNLHNALEDIVIYKINLICSPRIAFLPHLWVCPAYVSAFINKRCQNIKNSRSNLAKILIQN
jgi:hypothetical protein